MEGHIEISFTVIIRKCIFLKQNDLLVCTVHLYSIPPFSRLLLSFAHWQKLCNYKSQQLRENCNFLWNNLPHTTPLFPFRYFSSNYRKLFQVYTQKWKCKAISVHMHHTKLEIKTQTLELNGNCMPYPYSHLGTNSDTHLIGGWVTFSCILNMVKNPNTFNRNWTTAIICMTCSFNHWVPVPKCKLISTKVIQIKL